MLSGGFSLFTHASKQQISQGDVNILSTMYVNSHAKFFFPIAANWYLPSNRKLFLTANTPKMHQGLSAMMSLGNRLYKASANQTTKTQTSPY